jgi:hypothetical protein
MIKLPNKDREIFDLPQRVVDIIKEYQDTGQIEISVNNEGISLSAAKFYTVLDYICNQFDIDKNKITITTNNAEEFNNDYKIIVNPNHWIDKSKHIFTWQLSPKLDTLKHIGCFIGKPNWHRLIMSAWLYSNYQAQCLQTIHYDAQDERHRIDAEMSHINVNAPNELTTVINFIKHCPLTLEEGFINYTIGPPTHYNIIHQYKNIFADLVVETYVSGTSFFPTEKTLRPIIARTPFIIMGPQGYISNLQRMGFRTFDQWWDEGYDTSSDYNRIQAIQAILKDIFTWDQNKISQTLNEMADILSYNRQHLQKINGSAVKLNDK